MIGQPLSRYAAVCGIVLLLAGCGGGGGGGGGTGSGVEQPTPTSTLDNYRMFQAGNPSLTWSHKEIVDRIGSDGTTVGYVIEEPFYFLDGTNAVRRDGNVSAGPVADEEGNDVWRAFQYEPVMTYNGVPVVRGTYQAVLGDTRLTFGLLNSLAFGVTTGGTLARPVRGRGRRDCPHGRIRSRGAPRGPAS